jgi:hypothetical protein
MRLDHNSHFQDLDIEVKQLQLRYGEARPETDNRKFDFSLTLQGNRASLLALRNTDVRSAVNTLHAKVLACARLDGIV